jgi:hypothetical protein
VAAALNRRKPLCWGTGLELGGKLLAAIMSPDADRKGSAVPEVWPYVGMPVAQNSTNVPGRSFIETR